jgi:hypothetical protein
MTVISDPVSTAAGMLKPFTSHMISISAPLQHDRNPTNATIKGMILSFMVNLAFNGTEAPSGLAIAEVLSPKVNQTAKSSGKREGNTGTHVGVLK